ncbi:MAG: DNA methyltransferase [Faecalibacterium prausnitzii]
MGMYDEDENRLFKNNDSNGRFHSDWCSMMYSRLMLARNLLTDDGVIFMSIDDNERDNLEKLGAEIFGESNYVWLLFHGENVQQEVRCPIWCFSGL